MAAERLSKSRPRKWRRRRTQGIGFIMLYDNRKTFQASSPDDREVRPQQNRRRVYTDSWNR